MDIIRKRGVKGSQGNAAADYSDIIARAGSWQYGNDASSNDIEDESQEEDLAFGVPHETMDFDPPDQVQQQQKASMMSAASDAVQKMAKTVSDKVASVKSQYKSGMQQTNELPKDLSEARRMRGYAQQALDQDKQK